MHSPTHVRDPGQDVMGAAQNLNRRGIRVAHNDVAFASDMIREWRTRTNTPVGWGLWKPGE